MNVPAWGWFLTIGLMTVVLIIDVFVIARRPHVPSMGEASRHLAFYVTAAVLFGLFVWWEWGGQYAGEFFAGWLTEYSLSVDNLFVFLLIMSSFRVPQRFQQSALMIGIVIAIVLRGIFIALGAVVINAYAWVFYIFGAFLIYTAIKLAKGGETDDDEYHENRFLAVGREDLPGDQGVARGPSHHRPERQAPHHAHDDRHPRIGDDRPALRARLDPRDLRPDQGAVSSSSRRTSSR